MSFNDMMGAVAVLFILGVTLASVILLNERHDNNEWKEANTRIEQACGKKSKELRVFRLSRTENSDDLDDVSSNLVKRCTGVNIDPE